MHFVPSSGAVIRRRASPGSRMAASAAFAILPHCRGDEGGQSGVFFGYSLPNGMAWHSSTHFHPLNPKRVHVLAAALDANAVVTERRDVHVVGLGDPVELLFRPRPHAGPFMEVIPAGAMRLTAATSS